MTLLHTQRLVVKRGEKILFGPLDWRVRTGQFWLLAGANGRGKSTLLDSLSGLHADYQGNILLDGRNIRQWRARARARIVAYLTQSEAVNAPCLVREAVQMGRYPWQDTNSRWQAQVIEALALQPLLDRPLAHLSGGQRRAVELATVLVQDAPLLLLDEPLNQFDLAFRWRVLEFLRLQSHKAIVMASHDLALVAPFVSHALFIFDNGRVQAGTIADMMVRERLSTLLDWPHTESLDRLWKNRNP